MSSEESGRPSPAQPESPAKSRTSLAVRAFLWAAILTILICLVLILSHEKLTEPSGPRLPIIHFDTPEQVGLNQWRIRVDAVTEALDIAYYKAVLLQNGSVIETMEPLSETATTHIDFTDFNGEGELNIHDTFIISCDPSSSYELRILFEDYTTVRGNATWET